MAFGITEALKELEGSKEELKLLIKEQRFTNQLLKTLIVLQHPDKIDETLDSLRQMEDDIFGEN